MFGLKGRLFLHQRCLLELKLDDFDKFFLLFILYFLDALFPRFSDIKIIDIVLAFKKLRILKRQLHRHVNKYGI